MSHHVPVIVALGVRPTTLPCIGKMCLLSTHAWLAKDIDNKNLMNYSTACQSGLSKLSEQLDL